MKKSTKILSSILGITIIGSGAILAPTIIEQTKSQIKKASDQEHVEKSIQAEKEYRQKQEECFSQGKQVSDYTKQCVTEEEKHSEVLKGFEEACKHLGPNYKANPDHPSGCEFTGEHTSETWVGSEEDIKSTNNKVIQKFRDNFIKRFYSFEKQENFKVLTSKDGYPWKLEVKIENEMWTNAKLEYYVKKDGKIQKVIDAGGVKPIYEN